MKLSLSDYPAAVPSGAHCAAAAASGAVSSVAPPLGRASVLHRHLRRLQRVFVSDRAPIYFVTTCVKQRKQVLTNPTLASIVVTELKQVASEHEWFVGLYVLMPDHVHLLCSPRHATADDLSAFIAAWKGRTSRCAGLLGYPHMWQKGFFDHLLRKHESYRERFDYLRNNPVRAGLCTTPEDWPWTGEIDILR